MNPLEPLEPNEHVDLDAGYTVQHRAWRDEKLIRVTDNVDAESVSMDMETVRAVAELAGYEVREPDE